MFVHHSPSARVGIGCRIGIMMVHYSCVVVCSSRFTPKDSARWALFMTGVIPPFQDTSLRAMSTTPVAMHSAVE